MTQFRIFRIIDGVRVARIIELDDEMTFIAERDEVAIPAAKPASTVRQDRTSDCYETRVARALAQWCVEAIAENPLAGTDELRRQYFDELSDLRKKHEELGSECPPCEIGAAMRRYKDTLRTAGHLNQFL
jgi:hypothetical protein